MKILHTADLHIGQQLHGYDRSDEHAKMLRDLTDTAVSHAVDAVIVCGDVFDTARPSNRATAVFSAGMVALRRALPDAVIVIIAGNHDSGAFIESHASVYGELDIILKGNINPDDIDSHLVTVPGQGIIAAIPYTYSALVPDGFAAAVIDRAASVMPGMPVVAAAHTTVLGCDPTGHPEPAMGRFDIGNIDGISTDSFGESYDYLALGHIHRPQFISSDNKVRYSGSPLPVNFDERFPHSFTIADIPSRGAKPDITVVPVAVSRPLVNIPSHGFGEWDDVLRAYRDLDPALDAYVRLNVTVDGFLPPGARDEAGKIAADKQSRFCLINSRRRTPDNDDPAALQLTVSEFRTMPVIDIARMYAAENGASFDEQLLSDVVLHLNGESQ